MQSPEQIMKIELACLKNIHKNEPSDAQKQKINIVIDKHQKDTWDRKLFIRDI